MLLAADPTLTERLWLFSGKLHPIVVHFPIALILVAALFEFLRLRRAGYTPSPAALACLALGSLSAIAAAAMGWSDALTSGHSPSDAVLAWHRWLGIAVASFAVLAALLAPVARARPSRKPFMLYRLCLALAAVGVAITGHLGGSLVYGADYIDRALAHLSTTPTQVTVVATNTRVDFEKDIRPIFARRCLQCHSGSTPEANLNLDDRASAVSPRTRSGTPAIVPGKSADSRLVALISGAVPGTLMPPKGGALDESSINLIRAWIDQGAAYSQSAPGQHWHWAYRPPVRPNPPPVKNTLWPRNPIDHFVLARLESEHLQPAPEADRPTLIRRVSLDLTGLPPSVQDVDAFLADTAPGAYERLVDRLLASPRYGERFARPWLDLARYADTHGYEKDNRRVAWPFRDWVIDALNRDQPFDQFSIDQLAGDLLPSPTREQLIATGFHRNTMINEEGGVDPEEFRVESVIDRVNTTASVWLGSTLSCSQCHDHKFDPFPQTDYYRLFAIFNNCQTDVKLHQFGADAAGAMIPVPRKGREAEFDQASASLAAAEARLAADDPELAGAQAAWERDAAARDLWRTITVTDARSSTGATLTPRPDGSILASGPNVAGNTSTLTFDADLSHATWIRLELLTDPSAKGIGRSEADANVVVTDLTLTRAAPGAPEEKLPFADALADFEQSIAGGWPARSAIDADPQTGWAVSPEVSRPHAAVFRLAHRPVHAPGATYALALTSNHPSALNPVRVRISFTTAQPPREAIVVPTRIADLLAVAPADRTADQARDLRTHFRSITPLLADTREQAASLRKQRDALLAANAMVMKELDTPRQTHVFTRGSFLSPAAPVEPGVPRVLPQLPPDAPANRLTFARWLFEPANPLTSRVAANRLWEIHFGKGLVETSEDFGTQGDAPTHPDLLDWLATEFQRQGWSMKAMHRLIVTSATYMQSSHITPDLLQKDPANRLLARAPRFRLEAEMIRDNALAASGLLSGKIGGPSVFPPQPEGTWTMIYNSDQWTESTGDDRYRRAIYTFARRTAPYPALVTFDAPSREITCTRRPRTNTPLQALTTLNDPQFVEAAGALARRMLTEAGPDLPARLALGFRLCTARTPAPQELDRLAALYRQALDSYSAAPTDAAALTALGPAGQGMTYEPPELAAMTIVANVILNLDETLTRE